MKRIAQTVWQTDEGRHLLSINQNKAELTVYPSSVSIKEAHELIAALQDAVTFMESNNVAERLHDHAGQSAVLNGDN